MEDKTLKNNYAIRCFSGRNSKLRLFKYNLSLDLLDQGFSGRRQTSFNWGHLEGVVLLTRYLSAAFWSLKIANGKILLCLFSLRVRNNVSFRFAEYRKPRCNLSTKFKSLRYNCVGKILLKWRVKQYYKFCQMIPQSARKDSFENKLCFRWKKLVNYNTVLVPYRPFWKISLCSYVPFYRFQMSSQNFKIPQPVFAIRLPDYVCTKHCAHTFWSMKSIFCRLA